MLVHTSLNYPTEMCDLGMEMPVSIWHWILTLNICPASDKLVIFKLITLKIVP